MQAIKLLYDKFIISGQLARTVAKASRKLKFSRAERDYADR